MFQVVTQLLAHLLQLGILSQLELMLQSALSVEVYPVVHPAIGLGSASNGVVNGEARHALLCCFILHRAEAKWETDSSMGLAFTGFDRFGRVLCVRCSGLKQGAEHLGGSISVIDKRDPVN